MSSSSRADRRPRMAGALRRLARAQATLGIPLIVILFVLHLGLSSTSERLIQTQFNLYQANSVLQKSALTMVQARRAVELGVQQRDAEMMYHAGDLLDSALALLRDGMWGAPGSPLVEKIDVAEPEKSIEALSARVRNAAALLERRQPPAGVARVADELDVLYIRFREMQVRHERSVFEVYTRLAVQQQRYEWAVRGTLGLLLLMYLGLLWLYVTQRQTVGELSEARDDAERATRAKSDFLAVMSHEIRTPLNGVIGVTDLLERSQLDEGQRAYVKVIHDSGNHLLRIIDDILDFSRIEAGRTPLDEKPFNLHELVDEVIATTRHALGRDTVTVSSDIGDGVPPVVVGDRTRYAQILTNLLNNALKFTPAGEVSLDLDVIGVHRRELVIRVRDTGIGIDSAKLEAIYQPFAQADTSIVRAYGGTGLGLAITRRLVELMHGDITVRSVPGQGSEFMIHLPLRLPEQAGDEDAAPGAAPAAARNLKVLVVEDNPVNQLVTRRMLETLGHEVDIAPDGRDGVDRAREGDYDLVLMDLQMPHMSGLDAAREIRTMPAPPQIVALSANAMPEHRAAAEAAGMTGFLAKPVRLHDIEELLARLFPA